MDSDGGSGGAFHASTTAINAYVGPRVGRYLDRLQRSVRDAGMRGDPYLMQSSGGVTTAVTTECPAKP
jgi:N-methylhydantoinase A